MDFLARNKVFIGIIAVTLILLFGGVYFMSRGSSTATTAKPASTEILIPADSEKTSGIVNGNYEAASASAKVTLVEFGDYECPACGAYHPFVKQLLTDLAGKVTFVFRNFPLSQHANALISAYAAEAAGRQGKFWQMHDKIYETQNGWATSTDAKNIFIGYAQGLGLNMDQFKKDIDSQSVKDSVQKGVDDGNLVGITETPTYYLDGIKMNLPGTYDEFKAAVSAEVSKVQ